MEYYKTKRIIDKKPPLRWIIIDKDGNIVNKNPTENELKYLKIEQRIPYSRGSAKKDSIDYTKEELLNQILRFMHEEGRVPTTRDFTNNHKYPNFRLYFKIFGSWNSAIIESGLDINYGRPKRKYADKELLDYLIRFYKKYERPPTQRDFNNSEYPSFHTYRKIFGSWSNALKLVELDVDSIIEKGVLETTNQKGRYAEIKVINHFKERPIDLAGENCRSPCDGICPNGMTYDVKSSKLGKERDCYIFGTHNKYKENIEIYYFLAFNKDWTKFDYAWRVPGEIVEKDNFIVGFCSGYEFNIENIKEYDITDKVRDIIEPC